MTQRPMQCRSKKSYRLLVQAVTAMVKFFDCNGTYSKPYVCKFCDKFHLTTIKSGAA